MNEKNMQTFFGQWLNKQKPKESVVFELKFCKKKSLPFSRIQSHQLKGLLDAKTGLYWKIPDMRAVNEFTARKPFDCLWLKDVKGYLVIWFYKPRKTKRFYFIDVNDFIRMQANTFRKSITEEMAKEYSCNIIDIE